jgi:hypothetical protein
MFDNTGNHLSSWGSDGKVLNSYINQKILLWVMQEIFMLPIQGIQKCNMNYMSTKSSISLIDSFEDDSCIFFNFFQ